MIKDDTFSHSFIRINSKNGFEKSNIFAQTTLCFGTSPETRISLWFVKSGAKKFEYMTASVALEKPDGALIETKCVFGAFADHLIALAEDAQARLKKAVGKPVFGSLYRVGEQVDLIEEKDQ